MEELKDFRISLGIGIKEFADSIGVSKSLYEKIEYGFREPSRNFITRLKKKYPQFDTNIFFTRIDHISWKKEKEKVNVKRITRWNREA